MGMSNNEAPPLEDDGAPSFPESSFSGLDRDNAGGAKAQLLPPLRIARVSTKEAPHGAPRGDSGY